MVRRIVCLALCVLSLLSVWTPLEASPVVSLAEAQAQIANWREPRGILRFVHSQFKAEPAPWQEEALIAFEDPRCEPASRRVSLQAAAGVGKSAVMSWCAWYFLATRAHKGGHPKGFVTGITGENLRDNFWAEMSRWQGMSPFLCSAFTWSARRIFANDHASTWFLAPRNWPKAGSADEQGRTLSGLHGPYVAAFIDESGAIPGTVMRAAEQMLSESGVIFGKIMQAGNPISLEGMLYEAANRDRKNWTVIIVTNDPDDPRCSPRGDKAWARQQIETYGRDNPWVMSYILGKFPTASLNALLGIEEVEAAMNRELTDADWNWAQKRLGIDVARFGDDRTVGFARQGLNARIGPKNPWTMIEADTTKVAARAAMTFERWHPELALIDDTGHWGHGVLDNLIAGGYPALGIQFNGKAINPRYFNRRAEMWIEMSYWVKGGGALPPWCKQLVAELTTPTYSFVNGTLRLEEKEIIKKRLGRSPDLADALALTFSLPDMPNQTVDQLKGAGAGARVAIDHDPYAGSGAMAAAIASTGHAAIDHDPFR